MSALRRYLADTRAWMLGIIVLYGIMALLFATRTPAWQAPDEPAHYNYIRQIAEEGRFPVIEAGDWDSAALDSYKAVGFDGITAAQIATIEYEDHQPPLYYLLASPIYIVTDGNLTALRLFSALWGVVIIMCAYRIGVMLWPTAKWCAVGAAGVVAFQPMHLHILASVNNDALGWALVALILLFSVALVKNVPLFGQTVTPMMLGTKPTMLGVLMGVGLLTKATVYPMAAVAGAAILARWWLSRRADTPLSTGVLLRWIGLFLLPALLLGAIWFGRNLDVYGVPDFLGLRAHDAVVVGQPRTADRIDALGFDGYLREMTRTTFNSFWGQFGWMGLPLRENWYKGIAAALIFCGMGLLIAIVRKRESMPDDQRAAWGVLLLTLLLATLAYLYYNSEFQQYQGRYLFPMLIPLSLILALGVEAWRRLVFGGRWAFMTALMAFPLLLFDLYLIWRVIPPGL